MEIKVEKNDVNQKIYCMFDLFNFKNNEELGKHNFFEKKESQEIIEKSDYFSFAPDIYINNELQSNQGGTNYFFQQHSL